MKKFLKKVRTTFKHFSLPFGKNRQLDWDFFHKRKKILQQRKWLIIRIIIITFVVYWGAIFLILKDFIGAGFLTGRTLVLFTNEAEARPCGGFLSAFGEIQFFPPHIEFHNSYALSDFPLGEATAPLDQVSKTKNFWDLGTSPDLKTCAGDFRSAYENIMKRDVDHVVLFDVQSAEEIFSLFGSMKLEGKTLSDENFFSELSRMVADVDRHNEESLAQRKTPLSRLGKKMLWRAFFHPSVAPRAAKIVAQNIKTGNIFSPKVSPHIAPERNDFALLEWNLGGAKSSRFLKKLLHITARETVPNHWGFFVELQIEHLGGIDEPLSQEWKGGFELYVPKFLGTEPIFTPAEIAPGRPFRTTFTFEYEGQLNEFSLFRPRGQKLFADVSVSLFPQKTFQKATFLTHENVGIFVGEIPRFRHVFRWTESLDRIPPFITLHEFIPEKSLSPDLRNKWAVLFSEPDKTPLFAEIHLNEMVSIKNPTVTLTDLNKENDVSENPEFIIYELLPDERTLLLAFLQKNPQKNERFSLVTTGIRDLSGNEILPFSRTLIDRVSPEK